MSLTSCSAEHYQKDADHQVGAILRQKEERLFGASTGFSIEENKDSMRLVLLKELDQVRERHLEEMLDPTGQGPGTSAFWEESRVKDQAPVGAPEAASEATGDQDQTSEPAGSVKEEDEESAKRRLELRLKAIESKYRQELTVPRPIEPPKLPPSDVSLVESLEIAAENSRDYQLEKERVYLTALDLTFERYQFETQFASSSEYQWTSSEDPFDPRRQREGDLTTSFSFTRLLAGGGLLVFDFTNSLLKRFTGASFGNSRNSTTSSSLSLAFTQPLLRGAGRQVVLEPLIQSEREVFYSLRDFEHFRRDFAVGIAEDYYFLVQQLDAIENARSSYIQFISAREQSEAVVSFERGNRFELDQARTSELDARNRWIQALQRYGDALDAFKIRLGLPVEANLVVDGQELQRLSTAGVEPAAVGESQAVELALNCRLDYLNEKNRLEDADRQVHVAENALRAGLDLNASYDVATRDDTVFDFEASEAVYGLGVDLDLPLERLAERNAFRRSLIFREQQRRSTSLAEDSVKQDVRASLRDLLQLKLSYEIQKESVTVARLRVEQTTLVFGMGRTEVRDVLDAIDAETRAKNGLTAALVDYRIALIRFYFNMGLLRVREDGFVLLSPEEIGREGEDDG